MTLLNRVTNLPPGSDLQSADAIDAAGAIVGDGATGERAAQAFLLSPSGG
jgi:hypothetical protein